MEGSGGDPAGVASSGAAAGGGGGSAPTPAGAPPARAPDEFLRHLNTQRARADAAKQAFMLSYTLLAVVVWREYDLAFISATCGAALAWMALHRPSYVRWREPLLFVQQAHLYTHRGGWRGVLSMAAQTPGRGAAAGTLRHSSAVALLMAYCSTIPNLLIIALAAPVAADAQAALFGALLAVSPGWLGRMCGSWLFGLPLARRAVAGAHAAGSWLAAAGTLLPAARPPPAAPAAQCRAVLLFAQAAALGAYEAALLASEARAEAAFAAARPGYRPAGPRARALAAAHRVARGVDPLAAAAAAVPAAALCWQVVSLAVG